MDPVIVTIGNFELRWYSVMILIAAFSVLIFTQREAKRFAIRSDFIFNVLFWSLIFGIVGARLYYCVFNYKMYVDHPLDVFKIWNGGLAIHGGLLFGLITLLLYCKKYKVRALRILDFVTVPLLLGQAIGRWGNFFNQEAHGAATTIEALNTIHIPQFIIDGMTIDGVTYMPTFYFESLCCFVAFVILVFIRRSKYLKVGTPTSCYLIIYGAIRFFIEISRTDALMLGGFKVAQIVSVIMVIVGLLLIMINTRKAQFEDLYNDSSNVEGVKF